MLNDHDSGELGLVDWFEADGLTRANIDECCAAAENVFIPNMIGRDAAEIRETAELYLIRKELGDILPEILTEIHESNEIQFCEQILDPRWDTGSKCHNWRNHTPEVVKSNWNSLGTLARALIICMAQDIANNEDWD